jgi:hypothetical protein
MIPDPLAMIPEPMRRVPRRRHARDRRLAGPGETPRLVSRLACAWRAAQAEAARAYVEWCRSPGAERYSVYRAAQDRADAAQDELADSSPSGGRECI